MYGLLLRSLQTYVSRSFGQPLWSEVLLVGGYGSQGFEPLLPYDASVFKSVMVLTAARLGRPEAVVLEDLGTYMIVGASQGVARRLLRYGGPNFSDFLLSLEDLSDRARLALSDIKLPNIYLREVEPGGFEISATFNPPELSFVLLGALRAMADDYGALVTIEDRGVENGNSILMVHLLEQRFSPARRFEFHYEGQPDD